MNFIRVKEAPAQLKKGECVITAPSFLEEINACDSKKPRSGTLSLYYLREILSTIALKYLEPGFDVTREINISSYINRPTSFNEETNAIVLDMLRKVYPQALDAYVEYQIKQRPHGTNLIFFLGDGKYSGTFFKHGIQEVLLKDYNKESKKINKNNEQEQNVV
jgi:hypothetical protein